MLIHTLKIQIVALLISVMVLSGCSVVMASKESVAPNLTPVRIGATRAEIEKSLGRPISSIRRQDGLQSTYQYFTNDPRSYKRAAVYAVLDIVTVFLAELVTFPMEAVQGDRNVIEVTYDSQGRASKIEVYVNKAPIEAPEKVVGLEEGEASEK